MMQQGQQQAREPSIGCWVTEEGTVERLQMTVPVLVRSGVEQLRGGSRVVGLLSARCRCSAAACPWWVEVERNEVGY